MSSVEFRFKLVHTGLALWLVLGFTLSWFNANSWRQEEDSRRQDEDSRRQDEYLMHLLEEWRRVLDVEVRSTLEEMAQKGPEVAAALAGELQEEHLMEDRTHIVNALNLFEQVAIADEQGLVDSSLVEDVLGRPIVRYFEALAGFNEAWKASRRQGTGWPKLEVAIERWR